MMEKAAAGRSNAPRGDLTRRGLLASAGGAAVGLGLGVTAGTASDTGTLSSPSSQSTASVVSFYGPHQAGIATATQNYLQFAAFDVKSDSIDELRQLLSAWSRAAALLTTGKPLIEHEDPNQAPADPGEAIGLPAASLTITIGLGPSLFGHGGEPRLGLAARRPPELAGLPPFQGEDLDPTRSGGDLCIQVCADDSQVAFHAIHTFARLADQTAAIRWIQAGFGRTATTTSQQITPRNLMGFKDGTNNIHAEDETAMRRYVWVGAHDQPAWLRGGTYLVIRRIRILFDVWDATSLAEQEQTIGRHKVSGAPLGATHEHDAVKLAADTDGTPTIPLDAHIRLASPRNNSEERILRRGYSYSDGYDPITGQLDAGLFFIAYQKSPSRQFIPIQQRLAANDALNHHTLHTSSAIFAIPPGATIGGYVGETLL